ncbi:hypothetical protein LguiB_013397 [Lonicera macranthoides]
MVLRTWNAILTANLEKGKLKIPYLQRKLEKSTVAMEQLNKKGRRRVRLMVFQQLRGINGVGFYVSETFEAAVATCHLSNRDISRVLPCWSAYLHNFILNWDRSCSLGDYVRGRLGPPSFHFLDYEAGSSKRNTNADAVDLHIQFKHASEETEEILGSCNGLMMFLKFGKLNARHGFNLLMWNPSTGDCKLIPNPTPLFGYHDLLEFGYDSYLDDYKIVHIVKRLDHQKESGVDIYTIENQFLENYRTCPY